MKFSMVLFGFFLDEVELNNEDLVGYIIDIGSWLATLLQSS